MARQVARFAAGSADAPAYDLDLDARVRDARAHVTAYTGIDPAEPLPDPEAVDRVEWAEVNVDGLAAMLDPVMARIGERFENAGPLAGPLRLATGATLAAETGLVVGYMSQRVLGQYELSLIQAETTPRLLFVAPNLGRAVEALGVDRDSFLDWIVFHELTHALQFAGAPWLRDHLGGLMREYLETVDIRITSGSAGGLPSLPSIPALVERFREGGLAALVQTREQRAIMERVQAALAVVEGYAEHVMDAVGEQALPHYAGLRAAMAVVEGYAEHVMDAVGEQALPHYDGLREAMDRRRRSRSAPERLLQKLLGLDMKMRQYEEGKVFA
ncbi:MAG: hypothetical protein QOJ12_562, partial [Thermoleophilales bacterium]|nr:hypothetical protein [Thermoleophilales bacterium]